MTDDCFVLLPLFFSLLPRLFLGFLLSLRFIFSLCAFKNIFNEIIYNFIVLSLLFFSLYTSLFLCLSLSFLFLGRNASLFRQFSHSTTQSICNQIIGKLVNSFGDFLDLRLFFLGLGLCYDLGFIYDLILFKNGFFFNILEIFILILGDRSHFIH